MNEVTSEDIGHMRTCASYGKRYHRDIEVSLMQVFCGDPIKNHNYFSKEATGSTKLRELSFAVVDFVDSDTLVLHVSGYVDEVVDELKEFQLNGGN